MLPRLSSSLPSATACLARSAAPAFQRVPSCARFNSSDAAAPAPPQEPAQETQPKRRGVPLAQNLGDVSIRAPIPKVQGQQRGPRRDGGNRPQEKRREGDGANRNTPRTNNAGPRPDRARQGNERRARPPPSSDAQQPPKFARKQAAAPREQKPEKVAIPSADQFKVELGNFEEMFGAAAVQPMAQTGVAKPASESSVSPSQARVQLLLENTAGDYSRYVPRPYPTTDVTKLGAVGLSGLVLSRRKDVGLKSRENALAVVQRFADGKGVRASP
ncbi:hypothetical protein C8Q76DRAFT_728501 [Earliella scabrosa]|nr:hypothetical protein C8Q76DRAFT_728501 [Earliella scabrosa]